MVTNNVDTKSVVDDKSTETKQLTPQQRLDAKITQYADQTRTGGSSSNNTRETSYLPNLKLTLDKATDELLLLEVYEFATTHKMNWDIDVINAQHQKKRDEWFVEQSRPWRQEMHEKMISDGNAGNKYSLRFGVAGVSDTHFKSYFCQMTKWSPKPTS